MRHSVSLMPVVGITLLIFTLGLIPGVVPPVGHNEKLYEKGKKGRFPFRIIKN
jgi:hypothetical protein